MINQLVHLRFHPFVVLLMVTLSLRVSFSFFFGVPPSCWVDHFICVRVYFQVKELLSIFYPFKALANQFLFQEKSLSPLIRIFYCLSLSCPLVGYSIAFLSFQVPQVFPGWLSFLWAVLHLSNSIILSHQKFIVLVWS